MTPNAAALLGLGLLGACASENTKREIDTADPLAPKALLIGIDGLRGDGIPGSDAPFLQGLLTEGAWTTAASTQLHAATVSGPGWTSMLTGVDSDKHGIVENGGWTDINRAYPTLIGRAHSLGLGTATAIHWLPIQFSIIEAETTDEAVLGLDDEVASGMADLLADGDYDVHFAALDDVDHAGHASGFSLESPEYVAAVQVADGQVGQMLQAIAERPTRDSESWLVVVTSDHGGNWSGHGPLDADNRTIPLIVSGDAVTPGELTGDQLSHMDAHPTIMAHLGHPPQTSWGLDGVVRGLD